MAGSDRVQVRTGTTADATSADDSLLYDADGAEFGITDDRTAGAGDVRGWVADATHLSFTDMAAIDPRGIWATPGDLDDLAATVPTLPIAESDVTGLVAALAALIPLTYLDTDGTLAANSDTKIPSQKAVKTAIAAAVTGLLDFQGSTDCSANPNYPAANKGDSYVVSVAGKIGGASGTSVDVGDVFFAVADNAGGTQASVGASWDVLEHNLVGALLSANNLSDIADPTTARWNLRIPVQTRFLAVATTNQTLSGTVTIDGVALVANNRVLLTGQSTGSQNGPWQVQSGAWTRPSDFPSGGVVQAYIGYVAGGTTYAGTVWGMLSTGNTTVDSGSQTWAIINSGAFQPLDSDLTTIAGLTATTDNFLVSVASAWASRTPAQVKTTLAITESDVSGLVLDLAAKAPLASPALTGNPTAPTQSPGNNSTRIATTAYVDAILAAADAMVYKGVIDCSANPNYPAADAGWTYRVSVAGKIGGAAGINVEVGDLLTCLTDGTSSGNQLSVGANWTITQANIDGAVVGPASATSGNIATYNGTSGKIIQDGGKALPSGAIVGTTDTQTVSNKRRTPRVFSTTSTATLTPEIDTYDAFTLTAQAAALTIANHSTSTPADFEQMRIRILDNGTARTISFGTNYVARGGQTLPTTTVISKLLELGFEWNASISKWNLLALSAE